MRKPPVFSLIVPSRQRPEQLARFLASLTATLGRPNDVEVVLVVDSDDPSSNDIRPDTFDLRRVIVRPGRTMGSLNRAGCAAARGNWIMLLNDDVVVRTQGWDLRIRASLSRFPDDIVLAHVNDTLFRDRLCTFPLVSRTFCELAGGICPAEYARYRIDDHIEDVFNLLAVLGRRRTVYFPDLVFEHRNTVEHPTAGAVYASDPAILATDDACFMSLAAKRKDLALRLLEHIEGSIDLATLAARRHELAALDDPFRLRTPGRQRVDRSAWLRALAVHVRQPHSLRNWLASCAERVRACIRRKGYSGLAGTVVGRLGRLGCAPGVREREQAAHEARYPAAETR